MASKYTHDVVATNGTYKDNQGNDKKRYINVGKAFTNDQGQISIKLESVPVGPDWSGWLSLYEPKSRDGQAPPQQQQAKRESTVADMQRGMATAQDFNDADEDNIPF